MQNVNVLVGRKDRTRTRRLKRLGIVQIKTCDEDMDIRYSGEDSYKAITIN